MSDLPSSAPAAVTIDADDDSHTVIDAGAAAASAAEGTVTLSEVYAQLQADALQAQSLSARAGVKADACSYDSGAAHTQAVYWCRTCHSGEAMVGVCLGCSLHCHLEHDVEELFEKRGFTCDCGNAKAGGACALTPAKVAANEGNEYNHNFRGQYCYCDGKYVAETDVMYNCVLCQDWMHDRCVDSPAPTMEDEEFICRRCMAMPKYAILLPYIQRALRETAASASNTPSVSRAVSLLVPVESKEEQKSDPVTAVLSLAIAASALPAAESKEAEVPASAAVAAAVAAAPAAAEDESMQTPSRKRKAEDISTLEATPLHAPLSAVSAASESLNRSSSSVVCQRPLPAAPASAAASDSALTPPAKDRFVSADWSNDLCLCAACVSEYAAAGVSWLLVEDAGDSVLAQMTDSESAAPLAAAFDAEAQVDAFVGQMPRAAALDIIGPFQLFQASIKRQLDEFQRANPGTVVTSDVMKSITDVAKSESKEQFQAMKRARISGNEALPE